MHITGERRCIACREHFLKDQMIRISKGQNEILIDDKKKINGRGVYICKTEKCIETTIKKRLLNKAFSSNIDESIYNNLRGYIEQN